MEALKTKDVPDLECCYTFSTIRVTLQACVSSEDSQVEHKPLETHEKFMVDDPKLRDQTCSSPLM